MNQNRNKYYALMEEERDMFMDRMLDKMLPTIVAYMNERWQAARAICRHFWPEDFEEAE